MSPARVEVYTAVPLSGAQLQSLEKKLSRMSGGQPDIVAAVDPSLLGGVRVVVDGNVLDDTIKRKLADMKRSIYEGMLTKA